MKLLTLAVLVACLSLCETSKEHNPLLGWKRIPSRLARMPLNFGRRSASPVLAQSTSSLSGQRENDDEEVDKASYVLWRNELGKPDTVVQSALRGQDGGMTDVTRREVRAVLHRMPVTYGKRRGSRSGLALPKTLGLQLADRRSLLHRMPLSYGKRNPEVVTPDVGGADLAEEEDDKRAVLDRMPLSFGKRLGAGGMLQDKQAALDQMPVSFSKQPSHVGLSEETIEASDDKRAVLDRMPMTFGRRDSGQGSSDSTGPGDDKRAILHRMPISFGKRVSGLGSAHDQGDGRSNRREVLHQMPLSFGKSLAALLTLKQPTSQKRAVLDRMPLNFGKRLQNLGPDATGEGQAQIGGEEEPLGTDERKRALLDRMPLSYGKRTSNTSHHGYTGQDLQKTEEAPAVAAHQSEGRSVDEHTAMSGIYFYMKRWVT